tara:strand:- start:258 stop:824 length:567 start_codon:yes stop_codon:yes gene_type:complete
MTIYDEISKIEEDMKNLKIEMNSIRENMKKENDNLSFLKKLKNNSENEDFKKINILQKESKDLNIQKLNLITKKNVLDRINEKYYNELKEKIIYQSEKGFNILYFKITIADFTLNKENKEFSFPIEDKISINASFRDIAIKICKKWMEEITSEESEFLKDKESLNGITYEISIDKEKSSKFGMIIVNW